MKGNLLEWFTEGRSHRPYDCPYCSESYRSYYDLNEHIGQWHPEHLAPPHHMKRDRADKLHDMWRSMRHR